MLADVAGRGEGSRQTPYSRLMKMTTLFRALVMVLSKRADTQMLWSSALRMLDLRVEVGGEGRSRIACSATI